MIRGMELNNLSHQTQRAYLAAVTGIARFYNQPPDKITKEKIEDYLLYLKHDKGNAPNSCYSVLTGLRFFYNTWPKNRFPSRTVLEEHRENFLKFLAWKKSGRSSAPPTTSSTV
jgi:hypothetical protein